MLDKFEKIFIETNNEWGFVVLPNNVDENIPLVLHFHGNGGYVNESGADWIDEPRKQKFFLPVLESGFAIAGCHGTGNHWGRQSSLDANYNFFEQLKDIKKLNLNGITTWGCGLGASAAWLSTIKKLNNHVTNFISQQGVLNFESIIRHVKFKDDLVESHGFDPNLSVNDAIDIFRELNPINITENSINNNNIKLPNTLFIHGDSDENVDFQENPTLLHQILENNGFNSELHALKGVGHATYEHGEELGVLIANFITRS